MAVTFLGESVRIRLCQGGEPTTDQNFPSPGVDISLTFAQTIPVGSRVVVLLPHDSALLGGGVLASPAVDSAGNVYALQGGLNDTQSWYPNQNFGVGVYESVTTHEIVASVTTLPLGKIALGCNALAFSKPEGPAIPFFGGSYHTVTLVEGFANEVDDLDSGTTSRERVLIGGGLVTGQGTDLEPQPHVSGFSSGWAALTEIAVDNRILSGFPIAGYKTFRPACRIVGPGSWTIGVIYSDAWRIGPGPGAVGGVGANAFGIFWAPEGVGSWAIQVSDPCTELPVEGIECHVTCAALGFDQTIYADENGVLALENLRNGEYLYTIGPGFDTVAHQEQTGGVIGAYSGSFTVAEGDDLNQGPILIPRPDGCPPHVPPPDCDPLNAEFPRDLWRELTGEHDLAVVANLTCDRYLQMGLEELNRRLWYFIKSAPVALHAGVTDYALPSDYLYGIYLGEGGLNLPKGHVGEWLRYGEDWKGNRPGFPREWATTAQRLTINPPPSTTTETDPGTLTLRYVGCPDAIADCGPEALETPEWSLVTFWAVAEWFSVRRDAASQRKAKFFRDLFERELGYVRQFYRERSPVSPWVRSEPQKAAAR